VVVVALAAGTPVAVLAQTSDAESAGGASKVFDHFVRDGGPITWFVLIPLSVATIALSVLYCFSIRRATVVPDAVVEHLERLLEEKRYTEALDFAGDDDSMVSQVLHSGLSQASNGLPAMKRAIEEAMEERAAHFTRHIEYLNVIGNVSPMIGLFGTVFGMIKLFASIGQFGGNLDAGQIADDISVALVTTFWGLLVAIPALSIFALFRNRIDVLTSECALVVERLTSVFKPGTQGRDNAAATTTPARSKAAS
jgi:biopolymer transport protein ExbB